MLKVHSNNTKHITIANIYIPPRDSTSTHYKTIDTDIQHCTQHASDYHQLSSDHVPIITTLNIRHDYRLQQNRRTFINYKKADWTQFTKHTESAIAQTTIPTNIHTANIIFTNIILMADKHNIPKGKMHSNYRLLPEDIVCKITQRNNIRRANTCDPALKLLIEEITSDIQKHKQNIWKEHLDTYWDHIYNRHIIWKIIHGISNRAPTTTLNKSITVNNKIANTLKHIANCVTKQFTNTVKYATHKQTDPLTEQHRTYKDIISHFSGPRGTYIGSKFRIESHIKYRCLHINRIIILHRLIYVN